MDLMEERCVKEIISNKKKRKKNSKKRDEGNRNGNVWRRAQNGGE